MAFVLELAPSNGYYYQDTTSNDALIRVGLPNKKLHIGGNNQGAPAIATFGDASGVTINTTLNVTQDIQYNGQSLDTRYTLEANNPWYTIGTTTYLSSNQSLDIAGDINITGSILQQGAPYQGSQFSNTSNTVFLLGSNLGIRTSNPQYPLDITGDINLTGTLRKNGSPYIGSQFSNTSSNVFLLNSNLAIGRSNARYPLDVNGTINASQFLVNGSPLQGGGGGDGVWTSCNGATYIVGDPYVGIGLSNPATQLHVRGATTLDGDLSIPRPMSLGGIYIQKRSSTGSNINVTTYAQNWTFRDSNLVSLCNVGIGTESPNAKLQVAGNVVIDNSIIAGGISLTPDTQGSSYVIQGSTGGTSGSYWQSSTASSIYTLSNVGINTSNPQYTLDIIGQARIGATSNLAFTFSNGSMSRNTIPLITAPTDATIASALSNWSITSPTGFNSIINFSGYNSPVMCWAQELGLFVAVGDSSTGTNDVLTSTDGVNWQVSSSGVNKLSSICWAPELNHFVAVSASPSLSGNVAVGTPNANGTISWTRYVSGHEQFGSSGQFNSICWSPKLGRFVASSTNGGIMYTSNPTQSWSLVDFNYSVTYITQVCWCPKLEIFIGCTQTSSKSIMYSTNGISWTFPSSVPYSDWISICWSEELNIFVCVSSYGPTYSVMRSANGTSWTAYDPQTTANTLPLGGWYSVTWNQHLNRFIAVGESANNVTGNVIAYSSTDGITWQCILSTTATIYATTSCWSPQLATLVIGLGDGTVYVSKPVYQTDKNTFKVNPGFLQYSDGQLKVKGSLGVGVTTPTYQLQLSTDSAAKPGTNTWTISSDMRIKNDITFADLDTCYTIVKTLPLKRYGWRDDVYSSNVIKDRHKLGWIAQDVETVLPKAVESINAHGYEDCRTLNADQIYAAMYGAIQKLQAKVESLEARLSSP